MSQGASTGTRIARVGRASARLACLVLLLGLAACVSGGRYRAALQERDQTLAKNAELNSQLEALENEKVGLESALDEQEGELSQMRGTYDALVAELQSELQSGQVEIQRLREGIRVNLAQEILFPTGSAELDDQGREILLRVSGQLVKVPNPIEVEGHTDDVPIRRALARTYPTNWELAAARATRVVRLFEESGIDGKRLAAVSFGERRPVASNDGPTGRARNRRIEIRLLPVEGGPLPAEIADGAGDGA